MIETFTLITLCMLYLIYFRPGKTPTLKNPLVIERVGLYRMTLAPQLNLAQPFIESIAAQLVASNDAKVTDNSTHLFEVRDKRVTSHGFDRYLLTITGRSGMLYFHALPPFTQHPGKQPDDIRKFLHEQMPNLPVSCSIEKKLDEYWVASVTKVAAEQGINISLLEY